jgi:hypothetical protein
MLSDNISRSCAAHSSSYTSVSAANTAAVANKQTRRTCSKTAGQYQAHEARDHSKKYGEGQSLQLHMPAQDNKVWFNWLNIAILSRGLWRHLWLAECSASAKASVNHAGARHVVSRCLLE